MKIEKILGYFQAQRAEQVSTQGANKQERSSKGDSEAVTISAGFGLGTTERSDSARQARVQELAVQVASGSYKQPSNEALATKLYTELF